MQPISTSVSSESSYSKDASTCNNNFPPYWSFHSEARTFSKRQSSRQKPTPLSSYFTKQQPEQRWNKLYPDHTVQVTEQRWAKKSQLMRCRNERTKRPSTGTRKRLHIPDNKTLQKCAQLHHQYSVDLLSNESKVQTLSSNLNRNHHIREPALETKNGVSYQELESTSKDVSPYQSQETSTDDDHFLLIFPRRERGYVTIQAEDVKLLEPCGMLNDNVVDFMLKYIEMYQVPYKLQGKVHFFNSFFFTRLQSLAGHETHHDNIECLSRWTNAVVCNPGNILSWNPNYDDPKERPCILYFDSLGTFSFSRNCQRLLRSYLEMEWRKRHSPCQLEESEQTFCVPQENLVLWNVSAPQQKNEFDCGLFMIHYIIRFLQEPPNGGSFTRKADLRVKSWFTDKDIKVFREKIKQLIMDLAKYYASHPTEQLIQNSSI
ncbi:Probable ubiquitin-like-specific protease 2A [Galdieria sulphuraria]|nr:Probable ubiquitin-like-specific protease 2A [Galdieria sulphuraria]